MENSIRVTYEHGVFRPEESPELPEGVSVRIVILPERKAGEDLVAMARAVYEGLDEETIQEIETIALERGDFFGRAEGLS